MNNYLEKYIRELKNHNYSANTIRLYSMYLHRFLDFSRDHKLEPTERISIFLNSTLSGHEQRRLAWSAIKLFYSLIIQKPCPYSLSKVRQRKRLPDILSRDEIITLLSCISNTNHRMMIGMLYGSGLRVSEVCSIRVKDLDILRLKLKIRDSKGNKDRITLLSSELVPDLEDLVRERKAEDFLFLTQSKTKYSVRTIQKVFSRALRKSKILKSPTCHTLRHSFATHLVENGVDIKTVKQLLGHKSVKTTMIYIKLADIRTRDLVSPL